MNLSELVMNCADVVQENSLNWEKWLARYRNGAGWGSEKQCVSPFDNSNNLTMSIWYCPKLEEEYNKPQTLLLPDMPLSSSASKEIIDQWFEAYILQKQTFSHVHSIPELVLVVSGCLNMEIANKEVRMQQGDACIINPYSEHFEYFKFSHDSDTLIYYISIPYMILELIHQESCIYSKLSECFETYSKNSPGITQFTFFRGRHQGQEENLYNYLNILMKELMIDDSAAKHIQKGVMLRIFDELVKNTEYEVSTGSKISVDYNTFLEIEQFVNENLEIVNLGMLQKEFCFQRDYYSRIYKRHTGMSFIKYLEIKKIKKAGELLLTSDKSCEEIMEKVGYHNKGHFYKLFTSYYRMSPNQYRQKMCGVAGRQIE